MRASRHTAGCWGTLVFAVIAANVPLCSAADPPKPLVRITAWVDRPDVKVGEVVTITEAVPTTVDTAVTAISYRAVIIGDWDKKQEELVPLDHKEYRFCYAPKVFVGLSTKLSSHARGLDLLPAAPDGNPVQKGLRFKFTPKQPGMYLLTAEWDHRGSPVSWVSNPVVLIVRDK